MWPTHRPSVYGFQNCDPPGGAAAEPRIKMTLFPMESYYTILAGPVAANPNYNYHRDITTACCIRDIGGVANSGIQGAIGENFQLMPGIIYCASLSSPPISRRIHGGVQGGAPGIGLDTILGVANHGSQVGARGETLQEWIKAYPCRMLNNLICHYLVHLPLGGNLEYLQGYLQAFIDNSWWAGFNIFVDITVGSILSYNVECPYFLQCWQQTPLNCRIGEEHFMGLATRVKNVIIEIVRQNLGPGVISAAGIGSCRMFELFSICLYTTAAYIKSRYALQLYPAGDDAAQYARVWREEAPRQQDHNIHLYFYERKTDLLTNLDHEQGPNPMPKSWLGIGQYLRYLCWAQSRFTLAVNRPPLPAAAHVFTFHPLTNMIHRDAHAASTSQLCGEYDRTFFQYATDRTIVFGTHQGYKRDQHIVLDPLANGVRGSLVIDGESRFGVDKKYRMGILAGCVWSKFPGAHVEAGPFIGYPFFCEPLNAPLGAGGNRIPIGMPANSIFNDYWEYGLDEYILGRIMRDRIDVPAHVEDLRILTFYINWVTNIFSDSGGEDADRDSYWQPFSGLTYYLFNDARSPVPGAQSFYSDILAWCSTQHNYYNLLGPQITFNTFFGNDMNTALRVPANQRHTGPNPGAWGTPPSYNLFRDAPRRLACIMQNYNRYDRFDYYNDPALRRHNHELIALTNHTNDYVGNLAVALQLPMLDAECVKGRPNDCKPAGVGCADDAFDAIKCSAIPNGAAGGGKKYAKTRRHKK
jgi:hypothetical protein